MTTTPEHPHIWWTGLMQCWLCGIKGHLPNGAWSKGESPAAAYLNWKIALRNLKSSGLYYEVFP